MFCNKRSLVAAKKKEKKKAGSWVGLFENVWERGGGGGGACLGLKTASKTP
jgi:hypothetical protein